MARIKSINISKKKGIQKFSVVSASLIVGKGIEGDAHAAPGDRQVSMLAREDIDAFCSGKITIEDGAFAENITSEGIDLVSLPVGTKLRMGSAVVMVTKIGKECHTPCHIGRTMGWCVMPERGIFVGVLEAGEIKVGDDITVLSS